MRFKVLHRRTGNIIADHVRIALTFSQKLLGLMGRSKMGDGQGLYFGHCRSIHCFFMRFSIDVLFLDKDMKITKMVSCLKPYRVAFAPRNTCDTLELSCGVLKKHGVMVGDTIELIQIGAANR